MFPNRINVMLVMFHSSLLNTVSGRHSSIQTQNFNMIRRVMKSKAASSGVISMTVILGRLMSTVSTAGLIENHNHVAATYVKPIQSIINNADLFLFDCDGVIW